MLSCNHWYKTIRIFTQSLPQSSWMTSLKYVTPYFSFCFVTKTGLQTGKLTKYRISKSISCNMPKNVNLWTSWTSTLVNISNSYISAHLHMKRPLLIMLWNIFSHRLNGRIVYLQKRTIVTPIPVCTNDPSSGDFNHHFTWLITLTAGHVKLSMLLQLGIGPASRAKKI